MRIILPFLTFAALSGFSTFMKVFGWSWLATYVPVASAYASLADKGFSLVTGIAGLWFVNVALLVLLDRGFEKVLKSSPLAKKLLPLLKYAGSALTWGFGTFFLLSLVGINVSALLTGAGIGGLVFALASKEIASNLFGSLSLIFGKFFKIHDRIRIKGFEGTVEEITLSYTRLTDKSGHSVFMPNKYLTAEPIENLSESVFKAAELSVSLPSGKDVSEFSKAVSGLAKKSADVKIKVSVAEVSPDATKVSVKIESPSERIDELRLAVAETAAKFVNTK